MQSPRYESVTVALYDPVALNRNSTRNVLYSLGFREIEGFAALEDLRHAMANRDFDLIVLEATRVDDPIYEFVGRLRRNEISSNPFSVVLVGTWLPAAEVVRKVLDCGADDLLSRPFSTTGMGARLRTHALARKGFVVTSEYIGPDRRKDQARRDGINPIDVVNSMKLKAVDGKSGFEVQSEIREAVLAGQRAITEERMRRMAFQIGVIAGFVHAQTSNENESVRRADLEKIIEVASVLSGLAEICEADQAETTCDTVINVANNALSGKDIPSNAQLLVRLSVALQVTLTPGRGEAQCETELSETLRKIRARGRKS